ncbi:MAG: bifunctional acetate--CoA ligase family protein/GNAT family N-acetyltransferase [Devosia sp.]
MTIRNLDVTLAPSSVALIGATERKGSVGRVVLENIIGGGFKGRIYPVNLKYDRVLGMRCYRRIAELPEAPDLAVIATPAETVPELVAELGERGTKVAVIITAGLTAANGLRDRVLAAAKPQLPRLIGPNTIGLLAPRAQLNASFVHVMPQRGRLGLISQSGAIVSSIVDWAAAENIGFSQIFSLGDMADVDVGDCLNLLAEDDGTSAILMYLESIPAARKFMSAARAAARVKPVIAVKPGRHAEAARAAATHTGALAGADRVVDAALRRAGIIRVDDLEDLFNAAEVTARYHPLDHARVAVVTNGGGAGVLVVDHLLDKGALLAELSPATLTTLDAALPSAWSHANPVDIIGDAPPARFEAAITAVAADAGVDAVLVMDCPTAIADPLLAAMAVAGAAPGGIINGKPLLTCWLGQQAAEPARAVLQRSGIGSFDSPSGAAEAVAFLTQWSGVRKQLERAPARRPQPAHRLKEAADILAGVVTEGRTLLSEWEAKSLLACYGVPVPETVFATNEPEVGIAAGELLTESNALAVKMSSRSVSHKSDIGGVVLNIKSVGDAIKAASAIRARFATAYPALPLDGFTVQPMISWPAATELIAGLSTDPTFGPVVVFGAGGTAVEVVNDTATGLVPLDDVLAADLIDRTRVSHLLQGYRGVAPAHRESIVETLVTLSQLAIDFAMIASIDINPLLAGPSGVMALDARVEIDPSRAHLPAPNPDLAICPYPASEQSSVQLGEVALALRPIRPEDADLYPSFLARMDPEDLRMRFLVPTKTISQQTLIRLTQLDYDRDIAFVALEPSGNLAGIVRYSSNPDKTAAEFGILVRSDLKHHGLGRLMLSRLIARARQEGLGTLYGVVLAGNRAMLELAKSLGFGVEHDPGGPTQVRVSLSLTSTSPAPAPQAAP